jgi:hypothetical protein
MSYSLILEIELDDDLPDESKSLTRFLNAFEDTLMNEGYRVTETLLEKNN